jgi:hypothetical protein
LLLLLSEVGGEAVVGWRVDSGVFAMDSGAFTEESGVVVAVTSSVGFLSAAEVPDWLTGVWPAGKLGSVVVGEDGGIVTSAAAEGSVMFTINALTNGFVVWLDEEKEEKEELFPETAAGRCSAVAGRA